MFHWISSKGEIKYIWNEDDNLTTNQVRTENTLSSDISQKN